MLRIGMELNSLQNWFVTKEELRCWLLAQGWNNRTGDSLSAEWDEKVRLRIQLCQIQSVCRHVSGKGNVVRLCHRMVHGNIIFSIHHFCFERMLRIPFLRLQRRQLNPVTGKAALSHSVDHIPTDRTDIESGSAHIPGSILVLGAHAGQKLGHGDLKRLGQLRQNGNIWQASARFP